MAEEQRGFAGFESLVTDLSDLPAPDVWNRGLRPRRSKGGGRGGLVMVACIAGIVLAILRTGPPKSVTTHYPVTYPAPPSQSSYSLTAQSYVPAPPSAATMEEKPPKGQNIMLSAPQVRYCLSQGIRIQAADKAVNADSKTEVTRFLALVDDYNPRCGSGYRFALNGLQAVKAEVETRRTALEREGVALLRGPADEAKPPLGPQQSAQMSVSQLRYCLAQSIRIQSANKAVNVTSKTEVTRFLALVDDYNRRCGGNYRVQLSFFPAVREEVEAQRTALEREGVALLR